MGPVSSESADTESPDLFIRLAERTSLKGTFLLLLLLLMKFMDTHLDGREKGSLFLSIVLHGVGLLCGIDCRCVDPGDSICVLNTKPICFALHSVVHLQAFSSCDILMRHI